MGGRDLWGSDAQHGPSVPLPWRQELQWQKFEVRGREAVGMGMVRRGVPAWQWQDILRVVVVEGIVEFVILWKGRKCTFAVHNFSMYLIYFSRSDVSHR